MLREIKFRGKQVDGKEWAYGDLTQSYPTPEIQVTEWTEKYGGFYGTHPVILKTVGQYTGLKDKNGTEIYEGDIVVIPEEYIWFDNDEPNYRGIVEWIFSQWQVVAHCVNPNKRGISDGINEGLNDDGYDEGDETCWKVIGNIHDNPELLEVY